MKIYNWWHVVVNNIHKRTFQLIPLQMISYGMVGITGVLIQILTTEILMSKYEFLFKEALPIAVIISATSNYLINNYLTFKSNKLKGIRLIKGLIKFLIMATFTILLNILLANYFYNFIINNEILAQIASILIVFILNYVGSSKFVWKSK